MHGMDERPDHGLRVERMTDPDALGLLRHERGEPIIDALLDEEARRRGTALAVQRVDHENGGVGGAVEIGVGEDDHRVLAAELEMHALQRRRRPAS